MIESFYDWVCFNYSEWGNLNICIFRWSQTFTDFFLKLHGGSFKVAAKVYPGIVYLNCIWLDVKNIWSGFCKCFVQTLFYLLNTTYSLMNTSCTKKTVLRKPNVHLPKKSKDFFLSSFNQYLKPFI